MKGHNGLMIHLADAMPMQIELLEDRIAKYKADPSEGNLTMLGMQCCLLLQKCAIEKSGNLQEVKRKYEQYNQAIEIFENQKQ